MGFVGRPIGAAIFGHYGDRIGRKATLIATLLLTGVSTFLVAFVPGYASIGAWGAVILTILRMLQGIEVGGEWGGSVLIAMEWARSHSRRGLVASWPQFGAPSGLFLSNLVILAFSAWAGPDSPTWGWRIPFALSIVLIGIGQWIPPRRCSHTRLGSQLLAPVMTIVLVRSALIVRSLLGHGERLTRSIRGGNVSEQALRPRPPSSG